MPADPFYGMKDFADWEDLRIDEQEPVLALNGLESTIRRINLFVGLSHLYGIPSLRTAPYEQPREAYRITGAHRCSDKEACQENSYINPVIKQNAVSGPVHQLGSTSSIKYDRSDLGEVSPCSPRSRSDDLTLSSVEIECTGYSKGEGET